jgi:hypothetical protein
LGVKRTSQPLSKMSAVDPKETLGMEYLSDY